MQIGGPGKSRLEAETFPPGEMPAELFQKKLSCRNLGSRRIKGRHPLGDHVRVYKGAAFRLIHQVLHGKRRFARPIGASDDMALRQIFHLHESLK